MSRACPTVRVVSDNEQGYVVMNASDFNPDTHTLFEEAPASQELFRPDDSDPGTQVDGQGLAPVATPEPTAKPVVTKFSKAK
jgi:hypothetical protein